MIASPGGSRLVDPLFSHPEIERVFSDGHSLSTMLAIEAALARVLGDLQIIPRESALQIERSASELEVDLDKLEEGIARAGSPVIELVRQLREQAGAEQARYVHWGATTQDIMDTAVVLQVREALQVIETDLGSLISTLAQMAASYRDQVMAGRTHSQQALPITFGFKVACWLAPLLRHLERLDQLKPRVLVLQFGGAAGTLAAYGDRGREVYAGMGERLGLMLPSAPWHTQRDGFVELAGWLSLLTGSLGKMAQDVILLSQSEVGEVKESTDADRGGSSTMPQKKNPILSELIIAASRANTGLLSVMHGAMIQEHERGTHGLQLEWIALPQMFALAGSATSRALLVSRGLVIAGARMTHNVQASRGTMLAEGIRLALLEYMSPNQAEAILKRASRQALEEGRPLVKVVQEQTEAPLDWQALADEGRYLGSAGWFIDRVLEQAGG